ncbi:MAG: CapA family protein, partial [Solirubrobacteraceae bacterium]
PRRDHRRPPARTITLQWVGDMAMSSQLGLPPGGVDRALAPLAGTLRDADLTLGNLEGTLSSGGTSKCGSAVTAGSTCYAFQAPPSTAFALRRLGFALVNQANNHAQDFGPAGHAQTLAALRRAGIAETGDPGQITYLTSHHVRVAFLGFAPYANTSDLLDIPRAETMVRTAARHAAIVVVIIHAGAEGADQLHTPFGTQYFLGEDRGDARRFAHSVIAAGASVVLGSGPHVIRGVQDDRGHLIAYSLGNFIGYHTLSGGGVLDDSGIIRVTLSTRTGRTVAARWIPVTLHGGLPRRTGGDGDAPLVARLGREDFPRSHFDIRPDGRFAFS